MHQHVVETGVASSFCIVLDVPGGWVKATKSSTAYGCVESFRTTLREPLSYALRPMERGVIFKKQSRLRRMVRKETLAIMPEK